MKKLVMILLALVANTMIGGMFASTVGIAPLIGGVVLNGVALLSPLIQIEGVLRADLYTEIWTGETIKAFRNSLSSIGWLNKIRSYDAQVANNNTINFIDLGGDPTVLVNNTTYPIGVESIEDANKAIGLDKYQTKATRVTDDEARGLSYNKVATVIDRHREIVDETKIARALHALAPSGHKDKTPVLVTTGEVYGDRKRLKIADIISLKEAFDRIKVPTQGRVLVLSPEHVADLLVEDRVFAQQYNSVTTGAIANQYGFEVYEYVDTPYYATAAKTKKAIDAPVVTATDRRASIAFYAPRMMKATGETKAYIDQPDTQSQEWRYNLRHYFIALPLKEEAIGAIVSDKA